jgi:hypothetical protein
MNIHIKITITLCDSEFRQSPVSGQRLAGSGVGCPLQPQSKQVVGQKPKATQLHSNLPHFSRQNVSWALVRGSVICIMTSQPTGVITVDEWNEFVYGF